jgi:glutamate-1-semialdehyde 2,1-aminomutase
LINYNFSASGKTFNKGKGIYLFDNNGDRYYDLSMGSGVHILGYSNKKVVKAITNQVTKLIVSQKNNKNNKVLTDLVDKHTPNHITNCIFSNSGSEAVQRAVRLARASTGRMLIASLTTGWHGVSDITLYKGTGIDNYYKLSIPNINEAVEFLHLHKDNLAAFIIEPIQQTDPTCKLELLKNIESVCKDYGIVLIFDEIITGFRYDIGGITPSIGIKPDIIVYGKSVGGGLPIGITAFTDTIANTTFLDKSKDIWTGGTFSLNPLTSSASIETIKQLENKNYNKLNLLGEYFRVSLILCGIDTVGTGSITRILNIKNKYKFIDILLNNKVLYPTNGVLFISFKHTYEDIDVIVNKLANAYKQTKEN